MRPIISIIYLLCSWVFISCNGPEIRQINFNKTYSIKGDTILTRSVNTGQLFVAKGYLIALQFSGEYFLKIYDSESFQELGQVGRRGSGSNEFPTVLMVDQCQSCGDDECIWVHDLNQGELVKINVSESLRSQKTAVIQKVNTRTESRFHTAFYIDSTTVIGRSTNSTPQMNRLQVYNPRLDVIVKTVPLFPKIERARNDLQFVLNKYNNMYVSCIGLKTDQTRIASAMCSFDRIDIFDTKGKVQQSVFDGREIPDNIITEYLEANDDTRGLQMYYCGIFTSNDYIYTLYYGQLFSEYGHKPVPTQIRIFDWNGKPLTKIHVPDYLYSFSIDEKNGIMYGVDNFNKKILKYNIKPILNEL